MNISTRIFHPNARSLCYIYRKGRVLLGLKKEGFGKNLWNGPGGTQGSGESPVRTAIRETQEEVGVTPLNLHHAANLVFTFANYPEMYMYAFIAADFWGTPRETAEMRPGWFDIGDIPFHSMWPDDPHWLPHSLAGKFVSGRFFFDKKDQLIKHKVKIL